MDGLREYQKNSALRKKGEWGGSRKEGIPLEPEGHSCRQQQDGRAATTGESMGSGNWKEDTQCRSVQTSRKGGCWKALEANFCTS